MAKVLAQEGYETHRWGYPSRDKTIEEHGIDLVEALKKTALDHPGEAIHFVTHSLGGIIVRSALNHKECPEEAKIGKAVMLAPPNQGARFARFLSKFKPVRKILGEKSGAQLLFCDNFIHIGQMPKSKEVLVISGVFGWNPTAGKRNDGKIGFEESCLDTPHKHMSHFSGHSWIMYSDTVIHNAKLFILDDQ